VENTPFHCEDIFLPTTVLKFLGLGVFGWGAAILAVVMNAQVQKKGKCRRKRQAEMHMRLNLIPIPIRKDERDKAVEVGGKGSECF
jgi:hypothetical protein